MGISKIERSEIIPEDPIIVVITWPSGSGKTSVINQLIKDHPELKKVISVTTREMRPGEESGVDRKFVDEEEFAMLKESGQLGCIKHVDGNRYGIPKEIENSFNITDLDPNGLEKLRNEISANIIPIVLYQPPEVCKERMEKRGDSEENIQSRLDYDSERFDDIKKIINFVEEDLVHTICCPKDATVKATADAIWNILNAHLLKHTLS